MRMRARSFSHVGITVRDFNTFVRFYWDVFGCPLVGVSDTPPDRVRSFFGVDPSTQSTPETESASLRAGSPEPTCKIGWIRAPGGAVASLAFVEVATGRAAPADYAERYGGTRLPFDYVWFTTRADEVDHCARFRGSRERTG